MKGLVTISKRRRHRRMAAYRRRRCSITGAPRRPQSIAWPRSEAERPSVLSNWHVILCPRRTAETYLSLPRSAVVRQRCARFTAGDSPPGASTRPSDCTPGTRPAATANSPICPRRRNKLWNSLRQGRKYADQLTRNCSRLRTHPEGFPRLQGVADACHDPRRAVNRSLRGHMRARRACEKKARRHIPSARCERSVPVEHQPRSALRKKAAKLLP